MREGWEPRPVYCAGNISLFLNSPLLCKAEAEKIYFPCHFLPNPAICPYLESPAGVAVSRSARWNPVPVTAVGRVLRLQDMIRECIRAAKGRNVSNVRRARMRPPKPERYRRRCRDSGDRTIGVLYPGPCVEPKLGPGLLCVFVGEV